MLCVLLLLAVLITAWVIAPWPTIRRAFQDAVSKRPGPGAPAAAPPPTSQTPQTLEGILAREFVAGEITAPQYRDAMATVAARDAERHPLDLPPEFTPPGWP